MTQLADPYNPNRFKKPFVQTMPPAQLRGAAEALRMPVEFVITRLLAKAHDPQSGMIYFLDCGPYTKIGHTRDLDRRLEGIETHNPFPLQLWARLLGDVARERRIQSAFRAERHRKEWFRFTNEQKAELRAWVLRAGGEVYP